MRETINNELYAQGWTQLAGPFSEDEEHMMAAFIEDAEACNKDFLIQPVGYATGGYDKNAKLIWQRSKLSAAARAA
jgi:hypothetical protein